jgi:hypothetical protein
MVREVKVKEAAAAAVVVMVVAEFLNWGLVGRMCFW